jgi:hypothetical protein
VEDLARALTARSGGQQAGSHSVGGAGLALSRAYSEHMTEPPPEPPRDPRGPFGWPGIGRYLRGPAGLSPLSNRPGDVARRWLGFAAAIVVMVAIFAFLFLARPG